MSIVTTYMCDRCANESTEPLGFAHVEIRLRRINGNFSDPTPHPVVQWCRPCLVALGLSRPNTIRDEDVTIEDPPPTLEDIVRGIVKQALEAARQ